MLTQQEHNCNRRNGPLSSYRWLQEDLRQLKGTFSKDFWQKLHRIQLGPSRKEWDTGGWKGKQGHRSITTPCCDSAIDASLVRQGTSTSQFATQKLQVAEACCEHHAEMQEAMLLCWQAEGCSSRHLLTAKDVQAVQEAWPERLWRLSNLNIFRDRLHFLHSCLPVSA